MRSRRGLPVSLVACPLYAGLSMAVVLGATLIVDEWLPAGHVAGVAVFLGGGIVAGRSAPRVMEFRRDLGRRIRDLLDSRR